MVGCAIVATLVLGGGGSLWPLPELALQALLAVMVLVWAWMLPAGQARGIAREAWLLAGLIIALPLAQLIPLPPGVWHHLAGRGVELASLALVGQQDKWRPLSLAPLNTLASLLAMAAAAATLVMVASLSRRDRTRVLVTIVVVALGSMVVGAGQLAGDALRFYSGTQVFLAGFQANHNSEADVLLIAMIAATAACRDLIETRGWRVRPAVAAMLMVNALLLLGVVLTASRAGIVLAGLAVGAGGVIVWPVVRSLPRLRALLAVGGGVAVLGALGLANSAVIARSLDRFDWQWDLRPEIWKDTIFAARAYFPWGSGMGSFIPVFAAAERLEVVDALFTNRAHNDYLELLLEAGVPGMVWALAIAALVTRAAVRALAEGSGVAAAQALCAVAGLCQIGLHSLLDYPLRSMSLSGVAAVLVALLLPAPQLSAASAEWKDDA